MAARAASATVAAVFSALSHATHAHTHACCLCTASLWEGWSIVIVIMLMLMVHHVIMIRCTIGHATCLSRSWEQPLSLLFAHIIDRSETKTEDSNEYEDHKDTLAPEDKNDERKRSKKNIQRLSQQLSACVHAGRRARAHQSREHAPVSQSVSQSVSQDHVRLPYVDRMVVLGVLKVR
jgi:hypothetical protein